MRNRNPFFRIFFFFIFLNVVSSIVELGFFVTEVLFSLLPPLLIAGLIFKILNDKKRDVQRKSAKTIYKSNHAKKMESSVNKNAINKKLKAYFSNNYKLPLYEEIALTTAKGEYTDFESLYVSINDEMICSLKEFGENYPEIYGRILKLLETFAKQKETFKEPTAYKEEETVKTVKKDNKAQYYIEYINALNNEIPHVEITNSLNQTCDYLRRIDSAAKKEDSKLTKLYEYYLPILTGILENYKKLQNNRDSQEYKKCEDQLIKLTILINDALKAINESIHEEEYMNLNADMATLESLLKKDILDDGMVK